MSTDTKYTNWLIYLLVYFICCTTIAAQHIGYDLLKGKSQVQIPFTLRSNKILIDVEIEHVYKMKLLFDTGSSHNIIFNKTYTDLMGIPYMDTISLFGANRRDYIDAYVCRSLNIKLRKTSYFQRSFIVLENYTEELSRHIGQDIHGILGGEFIKGLVVTIDYENKKLIFSDPRKMHRPKEAIDARITNNKPYISGKLEDDMLGSLTKSILLDSGSDLGILFNNNTDNPLLKADSIFLGMGMSGPIMGQPLLIEELSVSDIHLTNVYGGYQTVLLEEISNTKEFLAASIGNKIMKQFNWTIDYSHGWVYIKKNKYYSKSKEDLSGLVISLSSNYKDKEVRFVYPNSPAMESGINKGDRIIQLGWIPRSFLGIDYIRNKLSSRIGRRIRIKVKRKKQKLKFDLHLRKYKKGLTTYN